MRNIFAPAAPCLADTALHNTPSGAALFAAIGGHYATPAQAVFELLDNAIASTLAVIEVGEILIGVKEDGEFVELSVSDNGEGIADLGAALTISKCSGLTPYNEHGCGLKSALSYFCNGDGMWSLESRTATDATRNRYRCVMSPYLAIDGTMHAGFYEGQGSIGHETGTCIRIRCARSKLEGLKPATKRTQVGFRQLVAYLEEEIAYTYAPLLVSGMVKINIVVGEEDKPRQLPALEPVWEGAPALVPEFLTDLGGGPVTIRCRYGTIQPDKRTAIYYKGNMASSGLEIRFNGRCIEHGLYARVYGKALHPSCNRFLCQIDLISEDGHALPATESTKNACVEDDLRTQALFRWIRANVKQPETMRESLESRLVGQLAEKKRGEYDTIRVSREERTYRSIDLKGKIDLLVSKRGGVQVYEAKAKGTKAEDLYQLRLYTDGCSMDGMPPKESILIGERHPKEVESLVEQLNTQCDPTGLPYHFTLRTWREEGITA